MAKETKQELAVIDFTKFSVAQLPELQGKKEEIASIIEANPIVEIVDNATYESAKKSRTAVKTLRTGLEKEQKDVKKKIKEFVLDVVDKEYDTLVLDVKSAEKERQDPIDVWEEKKEQERLEKVRLEQERIDGIKNSIEQFRKIWSDRISNLTFDKIEFTSKDFSQELLEYDRTSFQEFEVLFDDVVSSLTYMFSEKKANLVAQEQIRIDNLLIEEKNHENKRIQVWQMNWNSNIEALPFDVISEIKDKFRKSKLVGLKHYSTEYEEIYTSTEKRLHSQIELISKAEEQRIAQEKFLAEKKEFEEKQLEAKFQERKNIVFDEGYWGLFFTGQCNNDMVIAKKELLALSEEEFDAFLVAIDLARTSKSETTQEVKLIPRHGSESSAFDVEEEASKNRSISVGKTEFLGIQYTDQEGKTEIVEPAESVKKEVEEFLNNDETKPHEFADFKEEQEYIEQVTANEENINSAEWMADYSIVTWNNDGAFKVEINFLEKDFNNFGDKSLRQLLEAHFPTKKQ